jgi:hypothetical protein
VHGRRGHRRALTAAGATLVARASRGGATGTSPARSGTPAGACSLARAPVATTLTGGALAASAGPPRASTTSGAASGRSIQVLFAVITLIAPTTLAAARRQDDGHVRRPLRGALNLNATLDLVRRAHRLGRSERQHLNALETDLHLGPHHRTDRLARRHQSGVEDALGLAGTRGAPGPGPISDLAGQLDIYAARHAADTLPRLGSVPVRGPRAVTT